MTTNYLDHIPASLLRAGRVDLLLHFDVLEDEVARSFIEDLVAAREIHLNDVNWERVFRYTRELVPAFIKQAVDHATIAVHMGDNSRTLSGEMLENMLRGSWDHHKIMQQVHQHRNNSTGVGILEEIQEQIERLHEIL